QRDREGDLGDGQPVLEGEGTDEEPERLAHAQGGADDDPAGERDDQHGTHQMAGVPAFLPRTHHLAQAPWKGRRSWARRRRAVKRWTPASTSAESAAVANCMASM